MHYKGSFKVGRFVVFPFALTRHWKFGTYNIGQTKVVMIGPSRTFVHPKQSVTVCPDHGCRTED